VRAGAALQERARRLWRWFFPERVEPPPEALAVIRAVYPTLDLDAVSATDDFLQLGGSSLTAMEVVAQATAKLGKEVTVRDLLDSTTLRAFAARVDAAAEIAPSDG